MRPIYASPENYPRYVGNKRGADIYTSKYCQAGEPHCKDFEPIGYIPQINHTYAYFEATYGTINEKQVSIAESTCSGVYVSRSVADGGKALLSVDQLTQIAMERAGTARQAVTIMGALAEQYGFYGESASFEGGSESLLVIDPVEGWVFHILADPTGASAIWVAARVPDDSVAVVANMFSIRLVDLADSANFLGRADMWELAEREGLYTPGDPKDFTATFSDGEYAHKYYSGRRMWGVFRLLAPQANLPPIYGNLKTDAPYPFAVKVDRAVTAQDAMAVMRDWYEGTEYSTDNGSGLAGGPFGSPDRYSGSTAEWSMSGSWERTISVYRASDSYVVQARPNLPDAVGGIVWFGSGAPHSTVYVPILTGMLSAPDCLLYGWQGVYNLSTSYWAHRAVLNLAQVKFDAMIGDIRESQRALEGESQRLVDLVSAKYHHSAGGVLDAASLEHITQVFAQNAEHARATSTELFHALMFRYSNNYLNYWDGSGFHASSRGYPAWWLEQVGYSEGPEPVSQTAVSTPLLSALHKRRISKAADSGGGFAVKPPAAIAHGVGGDKSRGAADEKERERQALRAQRDSADAQTEARECVGGNLKECLATCAPTQQAGQFRLCAEGCMKQCKQ